mmetsp:Transcript_12409/g.28259  ORF Transcript_12409/g.28259 Transcript_12409/m.28259 type:complete len:89 (-) Transcript_12409:203-469(-)
MNEGDDSRHRRGESSPSGLGGGARSTRRLDCGRGGLRMEQELRGESVKEDAGDMLGVKSVMGGGCASSITSESFKAASAQDAHAIEPE